MSLKSKNTKLVIALVCLFNQQGNTNYEFNFPEFICLIKESPPIINNFSIRVTSHYYKIIF